MNKREALLEAYPDETFLFADGFDEAIIGVDELAMRIIYSVSACYNLLYRDMAPEDAIEYFEFNVSGAYVGDKTPIWSHDEHTMD